MNGLLEYLDSPAFMSYMQDYGIPFILLALIVSLIALLLEVRLPIRYYWDLPGHGLQKLLRGLKISAPVPVWGRCYVKSNGKPLSVVACELLDPTTNRVLMRTYSDHAGYYGFKLLPGKYLLRAVKTHYRLPSLLDPENVRIVGVDESFVVSVIVVNKELAPMIDLPLEPVKQMHELSVRESIAHYLRMFIFQLANAALLLVIGLSLVGLWVAREPFYGVVLAVSIVLLFVKLYVLETISAVTRSS